MEFYKTNIDSVITRKSKDATVVSGEEVAGFVKKGELILVENIENLIDKKLSFPFKKYTLWNGNYAIAITQDNEEPYIKAKFSDIPQHLIIQIQKPKVYITIAVIIVGIVGYSILKKKKSN